MTPTEYTFIEEVHIKSQPVQMLVRYTVDEGDVHLKRTCTCMNTGTPYPIHNWQKKFRTKAEAVYQNIVQTRLMLALDNRLHKQQVTI